MSHESPSCHSLGTSEKYLTYRDKECCDGEKTENSLRERLGQKSLAFWVEREPQGKNASSQTNLTRDVDVDKHRQLTEALGSKIKVSLSLRYFCSDETPCSG